jgi:hypothetical protein
LLSESTRSLPLSTLLIGLRRKYPLTPSIGCSCLINCSIGRVMITGVYLTHGCVSKISWKHLENKSFLGLEPSVPLSYPKRGTSQFTPHLGGTGPTRVRPPTIANRVHLSSSLSRIERSSLWGNLLHQGSALRHSRLS